MSMRIFIASLLCVLASYGQTTFATITGTVTDASGLPLPGASVEAVQAESGYRYQAQTNDQGVYTLANLREGTYSLKITAAGFRDADIRDVRLVSRDVRRVDMKMEVGTVQTSV